MSAMQSIVINNGTTDLTFEPEGVQNGVMTWVERSMTNPTMWKRLTLSRTLSKAPVQSTAESNMTRKVKLRLKLVLPRWEIVNGINVYLGDSIVDLSSTMFESTGAPERTQVRNLVKNLLLNSLVIDTVDNLTVHY